MSLPDMIKALRPHLRHTTQMRFEMLDSGEARPGCSRLGGTPDLGPIGDCPVCGNPMSFICQFNGSDFPPIEFPVGFFDFHYCFTCMPGSGTGGADTLAVFRTRAQPPEASQFGNTLFIRSAESGAGLPVRDAADVLMLQDSAIPYDEHMTADDPAYMHLWSLYQEAVDELDAWPFEGSFLGGYPHWVQGDETPICPDTGERMRLLAQFDTQDAQVFEGLDMDWGEVGGLYLFAGASGRLGFVVQSY